MRSRKLIVILLSIITVVFLFARFVLGLWINPLLDPWPGPVLQHDLIEMSDVFEEVWQRDEVYMAVQGTPDESRFWAEDGALFLVASLEQRSPLSLISMDLSNGLVRWQHNLTTAPAVALNSNHIYLGSVGVATMSAYELDSGQLAWRRTMPLSNSITQMRVIEEQLYIAASPDDFYVLDAEAGHVLDSEQNYVGFPIAIDDSGIVYSSLGYSVRSTNSETSQVLWETSLNGEIDDVLATDEFIFVRAGVGRCGPIFALNRDHGGINWQSDNDIASNITVSESTLFVLTCDAQLLALDAPTGQVVGDVKFTLSELVFKDNALVDRGFYVAADDNIVVVYFGDSQQLFAFRFSGTAIP